MKHCFVAYLVLLIFFFILVASSFIDVLTDGGDAGSVQVSGIAIIFLLVLGFFAGVDIYRSVKAGPHH